MREIKFRAFDAATKKFWYPAPQGMFFFDIFNVPDFIGNTHNEGGSWDRRFSVMQFTGLKDCNGVDIYEGDIVVDHVGVGVVEYSEIKAAFKVNYKDGFAKWLIDYTLKGEKESLKVIGNICQNSDLLGVKA